MSRMSSTFSSTMIGHGKSDHERHQTVKRNFKQESTQILKRLETHHHSHRHKIMQVQFPETINKLNGQPGSGDQGVGRSSQIFQAAAMNNITPNQTRKIMKESEFKEQNTKKLKSEYGMNNRKLRYNRGCAAEAVVSNIIIGSGPDVVDPVFPQNATHYQCLALTNKLSMPDAHFIPPEVAPPRRWLGDDKGWE